MKNENPILFKGKSDGVPGPKFKHTKSEMLGLYVFATFRGNRTCRKYLKLFLMIKVKPVNYIY